MNSLLHLSPSTAQTYRKCGRLILYRKVYNLPDTTRYAATVYGSAMHESVDAFMRAKIKGDNVSAEALVADFVTRFSASAPSINVWGEDDPDHMIEQGTLGCQDFYKLFKDIQPTETEKHYVIKRDGLPIHCIADCITDDTIYDYKFGRGLWGSAVTGEYMLNMATYAMAFEEEHLRLPKIKLVKQQWSGKIQPSRKKKWFHKGFIVDEMMITQDWINYYKRVYDEVEKGIKAEIWMPMSDNSGLCKKCAYRGKPCDVVLLKEEDNESE